MKAVTLDAVITISMRPKAVLGSAVGYSAIIDTEASTTYFDYDLTISGALETALEALSARVIKDLDKSEKYTISLKIEATDD